VILLGVTEKPRIAVSLCKPTHTEKGKSDGLYRPRSSPHIKDVERNQCYERSHHAYSAYSVNKISLFLSLCHSVRFCKKEQRIEREQHKETDGGYVVDYSTYNG
jgi:hypothetical protein